MSTPIMVVAQRCSEGAKMFKNIKSKFYGVLFTLCVLLQPVVQLHAQTVTPTITQIDLGTYPAAGFSTVWVPIVKDMTMTCDVRFGRISIKSNLIEIYFYNDKKTCADDGYQLYAQNYWVPPGSYAINVYIDDAVQRSYKMTLVDIGSQKIPIHSLLNPSTNTYFLTADSAERDSLLAKQWRIVETGLVGWDSKGLRDNGFLMAVYRFYIPSSATYFYTVDKDERARLLLLPEIFKDEGIAFGALGLTNVGRSVCPSTTKPVYRMFNSTRGNHRFTASPDTVLVQGVGLNYFNPNDNIQTKHNDTWVFEGIAFCVPLE